MAMTDEQRALVGHDRILAAGLLVGVMSLEDAHGSALVEHPLYS